MRRVVWGNGGIVWAVKGEVGLIVVSGTEVGLLRQSLGREEV